MNRYSDVNDAVARANATTYGLGSSVWGPDASEAARVGMGVEAGMTWINTHINSSEVSCWSTLLTVRVNLVGVDRAD
jgi:acyl-CoA reductase-like NAD-dependent aldehyde dehydrogenase